MTLRKKLLVVAAVLTAGSGGALCFRKPSVETPPAAQSAAALPLRGQDVAAATSGAAASSAPQGVPSPADRGAETAASAVASAERPLQTDKWTGAKSSLVPPQLPPVFKSDPLGRSALPAAVESAKTPIAAPLPDLRGSASAGTGHAQPGTPAPHVTPGQSPGPSGSAAPSMRPAAPAHWRSHTVMDGDTLSALATRYLGAAGRYAELLEANRNVLRSADMLPIGVVLRIPPQADADAPAATVVPRDADNRFPHLMPIPAGTLSNR